VIIDLGGLPAGRAKRVASRGRRLAPASAFPPIWPCFKWGLPCVRRHRRTGELLPRLFTLTRPAPDVKSAVGRRCVFCGTVRRPVSGTPPISGALYPAKSGLSSPRRSKGREAITRSAAGLIFHEPTRERLRMASRARPSASPFCSRGTCRIWRLIRPSASARRTRSYSSARCGFLIR
jgi:hypothetical protein